MSKLDIVNQKLTSVNDQIRELSGNTTKIGFDEMRSAVSVANAEIQRQETMLEQAIAALKGKTSPNIYENGYADGYNAGFLDGSDKSDEDGLVSRKITNYKNDRVTSIGKSAFYFCESLKSVSFLNVTMVDNFAFRYCARLERADFHKVTSLGTNAFEYCYTLTTCILRSEIVCSIANANVFNSCYHILGTVNASYNPEGLKDGYIYVPDNLVEQYKAATNWATFAAQIKPLSELEETV